MAVTAIEALILRLYKTGGCLLSTVVAPCSRRSINYFKRHPPPIPYHNIHICVTSSQVDSRCSRHSPRLSLLLRPTRTQQTFPLKITFPRADPPPHPTYPKKVCILNNLRHRNVVEIFHFFESPRYFHIVLELMRGGELFDKIVQKVRKGRLPSLIAATATDPATDELKYKWWNSSTLVVISGATLS